MHDESQTDQTSPGPKKRPLSPAMIRVLLACADAGGSIPVAVLVHTAAGSIEVAKASISRTLRRLRQHGFVELENDWGYTLTQRLAEIEEGLAIHEGDPEAAYQVALRAGGFFPFSDAAEFLAFSLRLAARRRRHFRIQSVRLTSQGSAKVQRLTHPQSEVNRVETSGERVESEIERRKP